MSAVRLTASHAWLAHDPFGRPKPADVSARPQCITDASGAVALRAARGGYVSFRLLARGQGTFRLPTSIAAGLEIDLYKSWYHYLRDDEGRIAGQNAVSETISAYRRKTPLSITFCDPNIVQVGEHFASLDPETTAIGQVQMAPVGRALIMAKNKGLIRVYADRASGRMLGAEMVCIKAENLGHLLAWCIQQGLTVGQLLQMPFYHPVIEEALQAALYDLYAKVDTKNAGPITELVPL